MKRFLFTAIFVLSCAYRATPQIRLEFTAHPEDKNDERRTTLWAKGCQGRIEDVVNNGKMYMLLKDCGKTTIAVSLEEKAAVKMPPMQSSPAADLNTGALFMQGKPQITVEKVEEKTGPPILGRATKYYRFKSIQRPDPRNEESVRLTVEEEFWMDPTLDAPVLEGILGQTPVGDSHQNERVAFAVMKGLPLRHRTVVTIERGGARQTQPAFIQEIVSISSGPFDDSLLEVPKGFKFVDMASGQQ